MNELIELRKALEKVLGVIAAHECTCFSCDRDGEEYCDCLERVAKEARNTLISIDNTEKVQNNISMITTETFKCPICDGVMVIIPDVENPNFKGFKPGHMDGVTITCNKTDVDGCIKYENVYGHGNNPKSAYEIACAKYTR